ncbi:hypothetical protein NW766_010131 [Fusarium irregulare]|uniref:Uncharacterized protein n=1 Tax=Fusarium irregulare TaxID=2494466 RepID=A0A9W8PHX1_9HYPO|nr:hypothetical protein NW766_010131 [Fusarium irregulare]
MATIPGIAVRKVNEPNCLILQLPLEIFSDILSLVIEAEDSNPYAQYARLRTADFPGTAPFKKLDLHNFCFSPKVLEALVRWPKELHTLSYRPSISQASSRDWTWETLQPILNTQMASLRELHIYDLFRGDHVDIADLRGFTMLERLTLPATLIGVDKRHIPRIIAPNLQYFKWQVEYGDGNPRIIDEKHEEWIRAVVEYAARQQQKLETIFINSEGRSWEFARGIFTYPWDLLDDIAWDAERFGIRIQYDEPDIAREEYEAIVHGEPDDD